MLKKITIPHPYPFKLRTLSNLQKSAAGFKSHITIRKGRTSVDAKSFIELIGLLEAKGKRLEFTVDGEDAEEALRELLDLAVKNPV